MGVPRGARRLAPGVYDHAGGLHVDLAELVRATGGDPADPRDVAAAEAAVARVAAEHGVAFDVREK
jgi:hypothetical protein